MNEYMLPIISRARNKYSAQLTGHLISLSVIVLYSSVIKWSVFKDCLLPVKCVCLCRWFVMYCIYIYVMNVEHCRIMWIDDDDAHYHHYTPMSITYYSSDFRDQCGQSCPRMWNEQCPLRITMRSNKPIVMKYCNHSCDVFLSFFLFIGLVWWDWSWVIPGGIIFTIQWSYGYYLLGNTRKLV